MSPRILVLPGSLRLASVNRLLAAEAARQLALTAASVSLVDLADYPMPIYCGDDEDSDGPPEAALRLAEMIAAQDALLIVTPEYNASIPPLLKNALDWVSRVRKIRGRPVQPFRGLVVALAAASPSRLGGLRALVALRPICLALGTEVLTSQVTLADTGNGFDADGRLREEHARLSLETLVESLVGHARLLGRHQF
ncbi:FMN reductase [Aureimonas sp. SA4125]|uniref:NADPH-dependent FMN reductase n=1 Tax=Aureimonas sp. SA4125 TaxID=2826993 RepID=UPI001CC819B7|nr:NAD(P)H-dependent oxidoreductase [Aureimonas sp. SA4125]BDA86959.1 FMN reductase [Aureimonas sp. SA4125]